MSQTRPDPRRIIESMAKTFNMRELVERVCYALASPRDKARAEAAAKALAIHRGRLSKLSPGDSASNYELGAIDALKKILVTVRARSKGNSSNLEARISVDARSATQKSSFVENMFNTPDHDELSISNIYKIIDQNDWSGSSLEKNDQHQSTFASNFVKSRSNRPPVQIAHPLFVINNSESIPKTIFKPSETMFDTLVINNKPADDRTAKIRLLLGKEFP